MDGSLTPPLRFPVVPPPPPGETLPVAPGVEWLRMGLPFALDHLNLWLLEDGPGWTIVDTGYATADTTARRERIFAGRLGGLPIVRVVVTHHHPDHIGLAAWLTERWQVPFWASEKEWLYARLLTGNADDSAALDFARRAGLDAAASELFAEHSRGYRRGVPSVPSSFQRLTDGQPVEIGGRQWRVIIGEGHSPELACLYCGETGVLISGDQILPRISPNVSVHPHEPDGDPLSRFLRSLEKLRTVIPPETLVLPSHNLPFFGLQERVDALAAHHQARCEEVIAACEEPRTAVELLPVLFRRPLDRHQTAFALGEALAHLHYLMGQGALARMVGGDGANRFVRADG